MALPVKTKKVSALLELLKAYLMLTTRRKFDISDLSELQDPLVNAKLRLSLAAGVPFYFTDRELNAVVYTRAMQLCLKYGINPAAASVGVAFGAILGAALGDYKHGYELCTTSLGLHDRYNDLVGKPVSFFFFAAFVHHHRKPYRETIVYLKKALEYSLEVSNLVYAAFSAQICALCLYLSGLPLPEVREESQKFIDFIQQLKYEDNVQAVMAVLQTVVSLESEISVFPGLNTADFSEAEFVRLLEMSQSRIGLYIYSVFKLQLLYLAEEYTQAYQLALQSEKLVATFFGNPPELEYTFSIACP